MEHAMHHTIGWMVLCAAVCFPAAAMAGDDGRIAFPEPLGAAAIVQD